MNILFSVVLALFVTVLAPLSVADEAVAEGARIFNQNCSRCHNARPAQEFHQEEWSVIVPHMREKAHMSGKEAKKLEAFIAVTLTADKVTGSQDLPTEELGGVALMQKFACAGCHRINGTGGAVGPALKGVVARMGREGVIRKILEPTFNNPSSSMPRFPLSETDAAALADALE